MFSRFSILCLAVLTLSFTADANAANCRIGSGRTRVVSGANDGTSLLTPVSKARGEMLSSEFVPSSLVDIRLPSPNDYALMSPEIIPSLAMEGRFEQVRAEVLPPLIKMINDARTGGIEIYVHSGYRSYETQCYVFNSKVSNEISQFGLSERDAISSVNSRSAMPGQSDHQLGTVVDLVGFIPPDMGYKLELAMEETPAFKWLKANAYKYGFALAYPPGPASNKFDPHPDTGYVYEPWHWRYVGVQHATRFKDCDYFKQMTLQNYLRNVAINPNFVCR